MSKREVVKFVTEPGRVSYASVFEPATFKGKGKNKDQKPMYQLDLIFDADTNLKPLRRAIESVKIKAFGKDENKWPRMHSIIKSGDKRRDQSEAYAGKKYITVKSELPPQIIDKKGKDLLDGKAFYSGCYAQVQITIFPYDNSGSRGVTTRLQSILKVDDGPRLDGRESAHEAFGIEREEMSDDEEDSDRDEDSGDDEEDNDSSGW